MRQQRSEICPGFGAVLGSPFLPGPWHGGLKQLRCCHPVMGEDGLPFSSRVLWFHQPPAVSSDGSYYLEPNRLQHLRSSCPAPRPFLHTCTCCSWRKGKKQDRTAKGHKGSSEEGRQPRERGRPCIGLKGVADQHAWLRFWEGGEGKAASPRGPWSPPAFACIRSKYPGTKFGSNLL